MIVFMVLLYAGNSNAICPVRPSQNDFIHFLRIRAEKLQSPAMKLALAIAVYLMIALILGAGILLLLAGKPWLLIVGAVAFVVAFGKIGCKSH
jgi:fatty acid desaturase